MHPHATAAPTAPTASAGIMETLRTETAEHHERAEKHPFQRAQASGALPRERYAANLGQMMLVNRALTAHLRRLASSDPRAAAVIREHQFRENDFAADLRHFGVVPESVIALPGVAEAIAEMNETVEGAPLAALGMHYVLEGSTNGGQYIARGVRRAYGLQGQEGTRALDPYGDRQRPLWAEFKASMNAATFTAQETQDLLTGARWMFDAVSRIGTAVLEVTDSTHHG